MTLVEQLGFPRERFQVLVNRVDNPDDIGTPDMALMVSDALIVFDHLSHQVTILVNVKQKVVMNFSFREGELTPATIAEVRRAARTPAARPRTATESSLGGCGGPQPPLPNSGSVALRERNHRQLTLPPIAV